LATARPFFAIPSGELQTRHGGAGAIVVVENPSFWKLASGCLRADFSGTGSRRGSDSDFGAKRHSVESHNLPVAPENIPDASASGKTAATEIPLLAFDSRPCHIPLASNTLRSQMKCRV